MTADDLPLDEWRDDALAGLERKAGKGKKLGKPLEAAGRMLGYIAAKRAEGDVSDAVLAAYRAEIVARAGIGDDMPSSTRMPLLHALDRSLAVGVDQGRSEVVAAAGGYTDFRRVGAHLQDMREREAARQQLRAEQAGYPAPPSSSILDYAALLEQPEPSWLIDGVLPERSLALLYSVSGLGKSFVATAFSASVAAGFKWLGRDVEQGPVLYIAAEGAAGLPKRFKAQSDAWHDGAPLSELRVLPRAIDLTDTEQVADLEAENARRDYALIVVDTLNRVAGSADENSATAMGAVLNGLERIRSAGTRTTALVIHHAGKSGDMRGSSAIWAAADTVLELTGEQALLKLEARKQKDAAEGLVGHYRLTGAGVEDTLILEGVVPGTARVSGEQAGRAEEALAHFGDMFPNGAPRSTALSALMEATELSKATIQRYIGNLVLSGRLVEERRGSTNYLRLPSHTTFPIEK